MRYLRMIAACGLILVVSGCTKSNPLLGKWKLAPNSPNDAVQNIAPESFQGAPVHPKLDVRGRPAKCMQNRGRIGTGLATFPLPTFFSPTGRVVSRPGDGEMIRSVAAMLRSYGACAAGGVVIGALAGTGRD